MILRVLSTWDYRNLNFSYLVLPAILLEILVSVQIVPYHPVTPSAEAASLPLFVPRERVEGPEAYIRII